MTTLLIKMIMLLFVLIESYANDRYYTYKLYFY